MISAIGKFVVKWNSGTRYYCCFLENQAEYFKCVNGLRGVRVATANQKDEGVVKIDEYLYFKSPPNLDQSTWSQLKSIQKPFFVSQFLADDKVLSSPQTVYVDLGGGAQ